MEEILIPDKSRHGVDSFGIMIDNVAINPAYEVVSVVVSKEINRIPTAKIVFRDGEASTRTFEVSNSNDVIPGKKIVIQFGRDGANKQVFKGIITKNAIKIKENGNTELHVECKDEAIKMAIGRKSRYYENLKDNQLFDELIGRYAGLTADAETTGLTHKELVQHHITDWDFLLLRAEANSMLVHAL